MVNNWSLVAIYVVQETLFKIIIKNGLVSAFLEDFIFFLEISIQKRKNRVL